MELNLFIFTAAREPIYFLSVVLTVIVSIMLHELAHGWMAIRHGDDTPLHTGHMTLDPLTHMGWYSIAVLLIAGIAWGAMPIDPTRLRGRYAEAKVAAAGPATNLVLALVGLTACSLMIESAGDDSTPLRVNFTWFLQIFGTTNVLLCMFNLVPVPPLDGSHVLANLSRDYARLVDDPDKQGMWMMAFVFVFIAAGAVLWRWAMELSDWYVRLLW